MTIPLKLKELTFNRKTANGQPAAIPVRERLTTGIPAADWQASGSSADVTAVAYPLSLTAADIAGLRVTATFTAATPLTTNIFIRAIDVQGRLLGDVVSLPFAPADVGRKKQFSLTGAQLPQAKIDAHTVAWRWESSADGQSNWQRFADSVHPVFVIVDRLKAPWGRGADAGDPHTIVPWHGVMERACAWAKGLRDADAVVDAITAEVFGLGGRQIGTEVVQYQNGGLLCDPKVFYVDDFLMIVNSHPNAPTKLNCQDINSAIATFSTILGCNVRVIRLRSKPPATTIDTNEIKVFGHRNVTNKFFEFHEVAATPGLPIRERPVWDACLMVDFDPNPAAGPHAFELAKGVAIQQNRRDLGYERRLLVTASQDCIIEEVERDGLRYPEREPSDGPATPGADPYYRTRQQTFRTLMAGVPVSGPAPDDLLVRFENWLAGVTKEGFRRRLSIGDPPVTVLFSQLSAAVTGGSPMAVEVFMAESGQQAVEVFLALAASYTGGLEPSAVGDFALEDPGRTVLFIRGPIVARLSDANEEVDPPSNLNAAVVLDEHLKPVLEAPVLPV
jgi:hypothetical protein